MHAYSTFCMCINFKHVPVSQYNTLESLDVLDHLWERTFEGVSIDVCVVLGILVSIYVWVYILLEEWVNASSRSISAISPIKIKASINELMQFIQWRLTIRLLCSLSQRNFLRIENNNSIYLLCAPLSDVNLCCSHSYPPLFIPNNPFLILNKYHSYEAHLHSGHVWNNPG